MEHDLRSTLKGVVPMATGALCPRRPMGGRGNAEREGGGAEVVWESSGYKQRSEFTLTWVPLHYFTGSQRCLCLCVYVGLRM